VLPQSPCNHWFNCDYILHPCNGSSRIPVDDVRLQVTAGPCLVTTNPMPTAIQQEMDAAMHICTKVIFICLTFLKFLYNTISEKFRTAMFIF
jgi:hypothetical protein